VTAPFKAMSLPSIEAYDLQEMEEYARTLPMKLTPLLIVADVPTCQNTLLALPNPPVKNIPVPSAILSSELI
jgi:hypothetical protein